MRPDQNLPLEASSSYWCFISEVTPLQEISPEISIFGVFYADVDRDEEYLIFKLLDFVSKSHIDKSQLDFLKKISAQEGIDKFTLTQSQLHQMRPQKFAWSVDISSLDELESFKTHVNAFFSKQLAKTAA